MNNSVEYEPIIGLEIHVRLHTRSKAFSGAPSEFGGRPNDYIDPYSIGVPGTLPIPNRLALEYVLRLGLACGCAIARMGEFARKHYFYPDLPKGYQITQSDAPLCEGGRLDFLFCGEKRSVGLLRIHLEEDAGKMLHDPVRNVSLLDFNRAGTPLAEIVTQPDLRSAKEAAECLSAVQKLVRFLRISDGNMEEGSLRCDANVSIRRKGETLFCERTELKNINSCKQMERAIESEIGRQIDLVNRGETVTKETRRWDAEHERSFPSRKKEAETEYAYLPDPDLPPFAIDPMWVQSIAAALPETPMQRRERYMKRMGLSAYDANLLSTDPELGAFFEATLVSAGIPEKGEASAEEDRRRAKLCANWLTTELLGALGQQNRPVAWSPVSAESLGELVRYISDGRINGKQGKEVFAHMYESRQTPTEIIERLGLCQITDTAELATVCRRVLAEPTIEKQIQKYKTNPKLLGFFVGHALSETQGKANPERLSAVMQQLLDEKTR